MKTLIWTIALVLVTGVGLAAQATERTFGDGTLPEYLTVFDLDGDGVLSAEEIQAMKNARKERHEGWLARWDTNGDGIIDAAERAAAQEQLRERIELTREERFDEADTDGDGYLTFAEFSAIPAVLELAEKNPDAPAEIFARLDANGDAPVSLDEFLFRIRQHRADWRTPAIYAAADVDQDGCLTLAEFGMIGKVAQLAARNPQQPAILFGRLDANADGCLSLAEFTAPLAPPQPGDWRTAATYVAADLDQDGCLTLAEFSAIPQVMRLVAEQPDTAAKIYAQLDADGDGCLTLA